MNWEREGGRGRGMGWHKFSTLKGIWNWDLTFECGKGQQELCTLSQPVYKQNTPENYELPYLEHFKRTRKRKGETIVENCLAFQVILLKTTTASWPNFELNTPPRNYNIMCIRRNFHTWCIWRERKRRGEREGGGETLLQKSIGISDKTEIILILPNLSITYAQVVRFWIYVQWHHHPSKRSPRY